MKSKHVHAFTRSKDSATVETCSCGKFRHTENAGAPIVAIEIDPKARALAQFLDDGTNAAELTPESYDENQFDVGQKSYLVLTDDEATERASADIGEI